MTELSSPSSVLVRVPCSTSNIGPGFDCLGLAFSLHNHFRFTFEPSAQENRLTFEGPEKGNLIAGPNSLFFRSMEVTARRAGKILPKVSVVSTVNIPNARGLGSSSTAVAAAVVGANHIMGSPLTSDQLLEAATEIEGHPDNATPALMGGLTASVMGPNGSVMYTRWKPSEKLAFVILSPDYEVPTSDARAVLPKSLSLADAVANSCRMPLLIDALVNGHADRLGFLTQDRMHEPYRESLFRYAAPLKQAALDAGACSVTISGAGPSILAITLKEDSEKVQQAWRDKLTHVQMSGRVRILEPDMTGAQAETLSPQESVNSE